MRHVQIRFYIKSINILRVEDKHPYHLYYLLQIVLSFFTPFAALPAGWPVKAGGFVLERLLHLHNHHHHLTSVAPLPVAVVAFPEQSSNPTPAGDGDRCHLTPPGRRRGAVHPAPSQAPHPLAEEHDGRAATLHARSELQVTTCCLARQFF